jgi:hypothetical protein
MAIALALCVGCGLGGEALLCLAPALLMAATMLARRYPGARKLARIVARSRRRQARPAALGRAVATPPRAHLPRGGLLIGFGLAVRPPPVAPAAG